MYIDLTLSTDKWNIKKEVLDDRSTAIVNSGHVGTHIDIPLKTEIPLDYMLNRALLFDVSHIKGRDIEVDDIDILSIQAGDCILFKTDRIKDFPYGTKDYFHKHPQLSDALIDRLIEKQIHIIAIDAAGIRRGREHVLADKRCEAQGIYIIENIDNLDQLTEKTKAPFMVHIMWLRFPGKTGLPCRVVASIE